MLRDRIYRAIWSVQKKTRRRIFRRSPPHPRLTYYLGMARNCDDGGLPLSISRNKQDQILRPNGKTQHFRHFIDEKKNGISLIMPSLAIPDVPYPAEKRLTLLPCAALPSRERGVHTVASITCRPSFLQTIEADTRCSLQRWVLRGDARE